MYSTENIRLKELITTYESRNYNLAIVQGKRFTTDFRHNGTGWNVYGLALKGCGNVTEAVKIFEFLTKALPKNAIYVSNLGNCYVLLGRVHDGIIRYKKAIQIEPNFVNALEALGLAYTDIGNAIEAEKMFARVIELEPSNQNSLYYLANLYLKEQNWIAAASYFKRSQLGLSQSHLLECFLCLNDQGEFESHYNRLKSKGVRNPLIGGIISHAEKLLGKRLENNFCADPLNYLVKNRVDARIELTDETLSKIIEYHHSKKIEYRGQPLLKNGKQSSGNVFLLDEPCFKQLKLIIESEITKYRQKFDYSQEGFIRYWPKNYDLFGWIVSMKEGGKLEPHNHKEGWLSGCLYLRLPSCGDKKLDEGKISFSDTGVHYPSLNVPSKKLVLDIAERDICLFPSSLFHETIPYNTNQERISFAFDVIPRN